MDEIDDVRCAYIMRVEKEKITNKVRLKFKPPSKNRIGSVITYLPYISIIALD